MNDFSANREAAGSPTYERYGIPELGFRNYWYPTLHLNEVRSKPVPVRVLGENLVVFRDGSEIFALADRCPHRGARLSLGKCLYPGSATISCPYHGWTFDGRDGRLVAALMEGPNAAPVGNVKTKNYPVRVHRGLIWIFVGDMEPVPFQEDLPEFLAKDDEFFTISVYKDYQCNWRAMFDNYGWEFHAAMVHRNSPELLFQPSVPFAAKKTLVEELENEKGLGLIDYESWSSSAVFPGLGQFPPKTWYRVLKPMGRGNFDYSNAKVRKKYQIRYRSLVQLPCFATLTRASGDYFFAQYSVPLDAKTTRVFNTNTFRRRGWAWNSWRRLHYYAWRRWAHDWLFSDQDRRIVENMLPGPDRLSKTDMTLIRWRKLAGRVNRRPPADGYPRDAHKEGHRSRTSTGEGNL